MIRSYKKIKTFHLLFITIIVVVVTSVVAFSKYKFTLAISNDTKVALMATDAVVNLTTIEEVYPGSSVIIPITIVNQKNAEICQVSQKFTIKAVSNNIPLNFNVCKDELCTSLVDEVDGVFSDESFFLKAGVYDEKKLYIKVFWNESVNDYTYADMIDYFNLYFDSLQVN